jgi:hypothetical protein
VSCQVRRPPSSSPNSPSRRRWNPRNPRQFTTLSTSPHASALKVYTTSFPQGESTRLHSFETSGLLTPLLASQPLELSTSLLVLNKRKL